MTIITARAAAYLGAQSKHEEARPRFGGGGLAWLVFLLFFPYV